MGLTSIAIAVLLTAFSHRLADLMQEGDQRYRDEHPWVQAFEPQAGYLATDDGRWWILRGWLLSASLGFATIGVLLAGRAFL